jgi:DNA-binding transcriptional LysR family regulator
LSIEQYWYCENGKYQTSIGQPDSQVRGEVRLTASEWLCDRVLARAAARLVAVHPGISIELIAGAGWLNLPEREADVAIRPVRYKHHSVTQSRLAPVSFSLYAASAYLAERGEPDWSRRFEGQRIAVMSGAAIADVKWLARVASRADVVGRCNGRDALAEMAAAGAGIVCLPRLVGDATGGLRRLDGPPPPRRTLWLGVNRECRALPRVRAVIDHLRATFGDLEGRLAPDGE